jgi:hypothetical protein
MTQESLAALADNLEGWQLLFSCHDDCGSGVSAVALTLSASAHSPLYRH